MLTNLFPPIVSGSSTQSAALARELARRGCEVAVITARLNADQPPYEKMAGVHVYRLPALRLPQHEIALNFPWLNYTFTPGNQKRIGLIIKKHRTDLIHLHNHMFDLAFSAVIASARLAKPLVITLHTVIKHPRDAYNLLLHPIDRVFLKHLVIQRADALICPDRTIEAYAHEAFGSNRTWIVPYGIGIPLPPDPQLVENIRRKYRLENRTVILSLGHVHGIRNRLDLIQAMALVLKDFPHAVLLIVGAVGTEEPSRLARRLGISEAVIFTGAVPHEHVQAYLEIAVIEAHWFQPNNPQNKTLGIAALEAMGAGKAILNTADENVYGHGVLQNGTNVVLIESGNSFQQAKTICDLLKNQARREAIGKEAKRSIHKHFSWESVCNRTIQLYTSVLN
jgi:glycosyltransferase involved in cell wall biosynthesis